jgi:hypothetical protein
MMNLDDCVKMVGCLQARLESAELSGGRTQDDNLSLDV